MCAHERTTKLIRTLAWAVAVCGAALTLAACGGNGDSGSPPAPAAGGDSFTFFDIGRNTRYSQAIREGLSEKLGNDAIEQRSIINLEAHYTGFLKNHLPELDALNQKLNDPSGERVDHAVVKLMYRYARKKNAPFDYIEILFGADSRRPVFIRTKFKVDEAGALETLRARHGPPQEIPWDIDGGRSLVWRLHTDLLVASLVPNQFGRPEYQICIYFTENLAGMISAEQGRDAQKAGQRSRTAQDVF